MTIIETTARNATLADLANVLRDQHARKVDVVAPASALRSRGGIIHVNGTDVQLTEDGVTITAGAYRPTEVFDAHVADKLDIGLKYVRRLRAERPDLYDANVNGWLHGKTIVRGAEREIIAPADARMFLFRGFKPGAEGEPGVARALLSDRFAMGMDNIDILTATLAGVRESGVAVDVTGCDLTDRRMYVKVSAPAVAALAPELLAGYRSPFTGATGDENPTVFAGFVISNSETGGGAFTITPTLTVEICKNGMTMTKDVIRAVHSGGRLEEGIIRWSEDTEQKNLAVITAKARDAVATFLDVDYVRKSIAALERSAGVPVVNAVETVTAVGKKLAFSQAEIDGTLDFFIRGGQLTAGGVMQAITAYVQTVTDADAAHDLGGKAVDAMALCAAGR